jgi:hypothetical protein
VGEFISKYGNPWSPDQWNVTTQGLFVTTYGLRRAREYAAKAGTTLGGPMAETPGPRAVVPAIIHKKIVEQGTGGASSDTGAQILAKLLTVDGSGSGLDADLLDGHSGAYYLAWTNFSGVPSSFPPDAHDHPQSEITGLVAALAAKLDASSYTAADVLSKLVDVDGSGSGLDADFLDGQNGAYYLAASSYTAADVLSKLLGVDGDGSGLDADLLDGQHSSFYVRGQDNFIINGAMMVSQQNLDVSSSSNGWYPADLFYHEHSHNGTCTAAQVVSATPGGSPNRIRLTVTATDTSIGAAQYQKIATRLEGYRVAPFRFGSASAATITLRFGVKAPAGTYCVGFRNAASNRAYIAEYVISSGEANTDVVKTITLDGDQSGTWVTNNGIGLEIVWSLVAGTDWHNTAGSWHATNDLTTSNQFNFMGTNGNVFELFDVGLHIGSAAPVVYKVQPFDLTLIECQRYFQTIVHGTIGASAPVGIGYVLGASDAYVTVRLPTTLRALGTLIISSASYFLTLSGAGFHVPNSITIDTNGVEAIHLHVPTSALYTLGQAMALRANSSNAVLFIDARL